MSIRLVAKIIVGTNESKRLLARRPRRRERMAKNRIIDFGSINFSRKFFSHRL